MSDIKAVLQEFVATANDPKAEGNLDKALSVFPELKGYDKTVLEEYVATANDPNAKGDWDKVNGAFPELFKPIVPMARTAKQDIALVPEISIPEYKEVVAPAPTAPIARINPTNAGVNTQIGAPENVPNNSTNWFGDVWKGLNSASITAVGEVGHALEDQALKVSDLMKGVSSNTGWQKYWDEQKKNTAKNIVGIKAYKATAPKLEGTFAQSLGGMLPFVGMAAASIMLKSPQLATATTGLFAEMGYGGGIDAYDKQMEATGQAVDAYARTGAGALYAAAMSLPMASYLGKFMPKGVFQKVLGKTLTANPQMLGVAGKEIVENFMRTSPGLAKQLITTAGKGALHGVAAMEFMNLSKLAVDNWLIGRDVDSKEFWDTASESATSGAMFGLMTAPFGVYGQNSANNARREAQREVMLAMTAKGEAVEVIPTKNGVNKGLTPDGKLVDLTSAEIQNSITMTTKDFNQARQSFKDNGKMSEGADKTISEYEKQFNSKQPYVESMRSEYEYDKNAYIEQRKAEMQQSIEFAKENLKNPLEENYDGMKISNHEYYKKEIVAYEAEIAKLEAVQKAFQEKENPTPLVDPNIERNSYVNRVSQSLERIAHKDSEGNMFLYAAKDENGNNVYVVGKDKDGNYEAVDGSGNPKTLPAETELQRASIGDVHQAIVAKYDEMKAYDATPEATRQPALEEQPVINHTEKVEAIKVELETKKQEAEDRLTQLSNKDTGSIEVVKLSDGRTVNLTGGALVYKGDGTIDFEQSPKTLYYLDPETGKKLPIPLDHIESLVGKTPTELAISEKQAQIESATLGHANYQKGMNVVLLNQDGTPQLGENNQPVATTLLDVTDEGVVFQTAEGVVQTMPFEQAYTMLAHAEDHMTDFKAGDAFQVGEDTVVVNHPNNDGTYAVTIHFADGTQQSSDMPADALKQLAPQTETPQPAVVLPVDKKGAVDFNSITDPQAYLEGLQQEFGEETPTIVDELITDATVELEKAGTQTNAIERRRAQKAANDKITVLEGVKQLLNPAPVVESAPVQPVVELTDSTAPMPGQETIEVEIPAPVATFDNSPQAIADKVDQLKKAFGIRLSTQVVGTKAELIQAIQDAGASGEVLVNFAERVNRPNTISTGVTYNGTLYINAEHIATDYKLVRTVLHEGVHLANDRFFTTSELEALYQRAETVINAILPEGYISQPSKIKADEALAFEIEGLLDSNTLDEIMQGVDLSNVPTQILPEVIQILNILTDGKYKQDSAIQQQGGQGGIATDTGSEQGSGGDLQPIDAGGESAASGLQPTMPTADNGGGDGGFASLTQQRAELQAQADALTAEAIANPAEKYRISGKKGAINKRIKALDSQIAQEEADKIAADIAAQEPNLTPTEAQQEAGNYKKAHITVQGMDISVENPVGATRKGVDEDGKAWEHVMKSHYGYFTKTEGADGDHIDVFVGENPTSDKVFVIDQVNPATGDFDESKVMVGYNTAEEAKAAYMENYDKDWKGFGKMTETTVIGLKNWLYDGAVQTATFAEYAEKVGVPAHTESNKVKHSVGGFEYFITDTPSLKGIDLSVEMSAKAYENIQLQGKNYKSGEDWNRVLLGDVKSEGNGWYLVNHDVSRATYELFSPNTGEFIKIGHKAGGVVGIALSDFIDNNPRITKGYLKDTPAPTNPNVAKSGDLKGVTVVEYRDNGLTLYYGTKSNGVEISVKGMSSEDIKKEIAFEKGMLEREKRNAANFNEEEIRQSRGMSGLEKEQVIKMHKQSLLNIEQVERIVLPFYEGHLKDTPAPSKVADKSIEQRKKAAMGEYFKLTKTSLEAFQALTDEERNSVRADFKKWLESNPPELVDLVEVKGVEERSEATAKAHAQIDEQVKHLESLLERKVSDAAVEIYSKNILFLRGGELVKRALRIMDTLGSYEAFIKKLETFDANGIPVGNLKVLKTGFGFSAWIGDTAGRGRGEDDLKAAFDLMEGVAKQAETAISKTELEQLQGVILTAFEHYQYFKNGNPRLMVQAAYDLATAEMVKRGLVTPEQATFINNKMAYLTLSLVEKGGERIEKLLEEYKKLPTTNATEVRNGDNMDGADKVKQPETLLEIANAAREQLDTKKLEEFTFKKTSPMQRATALTQLEKPLRLQDNSILPIYKWIEGLENGLKTGVERISSSKSDKGYVEKMVIGDHILRTKAEMDYYEYLETGAMSYSEYLKLKAEVDKAAQAVRDAKLNEVAERDAAFNKAQEKQRRERHLEGLAYALTHSVEDYAAQSTAALRKELNEVKSLKQNKASKEQIEYLERQIPRVEEDAREMHTLANNLYTLDSEGKAQPKYSYAVGDKVIVTRWKPNVETIVTEVKDKEGGKTYVVEKREGIFNAYLGYDSLLPAEGTKPTTPTEPTKDTTEKPVEYKDGRTLEGKAEAIAAVKALLAAKKGAPRLRQEVTPEAVVTTNEATPLDDETFTAASKLTGYLLDEGKLSFDEYAKGMVDIFDADIVPYLQTLYIGSMWNPGFAKYRPQMSSIAEVDAYKLETLTQKQDKVTENPVSLDDQKFIKEHVIFGTIPKTNSNESDKNGMGESSPLENGGKQPLDATDMGTGRTADPVEGDRVQGSGRATVGSGNSEAGSGQGFGSRDNDKLAGTSGNTGGRTGGNTDGETNGQDLQPATSTVARNTRNHVIPRGTSVAPNGDVNKITANIAAIKLAKRLNESGEIATPEQKEVLVKYTGWGGLSAVFKPDNARYKILKDALTDEEYEAARASTTTAFYTPPAITSATWGMIEKLGFKGGEVLEPSAGIGHFFGLMPRGLSEVSNLRGVELDNISGLVLKALYPDAKVSIAGFEAQRIANNSLDLVVTNVPFGDFKVHDKNDKDLSRAFNIHDYFIAKSVRKLKPGGIGVFITTSSTMDKSTALRNWVINEGNADFIDVVRLNSDTFKQAAGTEATADIIIIRKRDANGKSEFAKNVQDVTTLREAPYQEKTGKRVVNPDPRGYGYVDEVKDKVASMRINKYLAENPDRMAGEMKFGMEGGNEIRPTEQRLAPAKGINQETVLADFTKGLPANVFGAQANVERKALESDGTKEGGLTVIDGQPYVVRYGEAVPVGWNSNKVNGRTKTQVVEDYNAIKGAINELLEAERADLPNIEDLRKQLNKVYDAFVANYGTLSSNQRITFLKGDVDFPAISAVEDVDKKTDIVTNKDTITVTKSDIFSKRTVDPAQVLKAENVEDAIKVSIYHSGLLDTAFVAELLGMDEADVKAEILEKGLGYNNPSTGLIEDKAAYLSGNVRIKLEQAEQANDADGNGLYRENINALKGVIPMDIPQHLIKVGLGGTWVPMEAYNLFFKETFGVDIKLHKNKADKFMGEARNANATSNVELGVTGVRIHPASELALNFMNNKTTVVQMWGYVGEKRAKVKDPAATSVAASKAADIAGMFDKWARSASNPFGEQMTEAYNYIYNATVESKQDIDQAIKRGLEMVEESPYYDAALKKDSNPERALPMAFAEAIRDFGKQLPEDIQKEFNHIRSQVVFPGAATVKVLRAHQIAGVIKALRNATLLAHEVGTGKTMTLITTAMEMRRLGMAKKPCIVVQRSTYEQFVKEIKELYPQAKVLVPSATDLTAAQRQQLFAKIAYNDWDIVVLYHGYLDGIPDDPTRVNNYIDELIEEKLELLEEVRATNDANAGRIAAEIEKSIKTLGEKRQTVSIKQTEKTKAKAGAKAENLLDRRTDNVMTFEQLGIDALLVDEAHAYKKLGFNTSMQGVKGIDTGASQRAQSMRLKSSYILENNNGKNVVFATGTPISNTFAELWTFLRYLLPKAELSRLQMNNFDAFVNNFGTVEESIEFGANGSFKPTQRFTGFSNVPELIAAWKQVAHTVLTADIPTLKEGVGTPRVKDGKPRDHMIPQTVSLKRVMRGIKDLLTRWEGLPPMEKKAQKHIPVVMYGVAKRAAIDVRLVDSSLPDEPGSKTNEAVKIILADLEATKSYKGTIAVFCDAVKSSDGKFNIHQDIKQKLVAEGIPAEQIAVVDDYAAGDKRSALWEKVNTGDVRVVIGSTDKMGVGVNIQTRLHALVHLDVPVRPSDYMQRNGRIIRQGNMHLDMGEEVDVIRLGVTGTMDVTGYGRLDIKEKGSNQVMKGTTERSIEEEDPDGGSDHSNFAEMMGKLSGSQAAAAIASEKSKLTKLENARAYHVQNQMHMANAVKHNKSVIATTGERAANVKADIAKIEGLFGGREITSLKVGGVAAESVDEAGIKAALATINKQIDKEVKKLKDDTDRLAAGKSSLHTTLEINGVKFEVFIAIEKKYDFEDKAPKVYKTVTYTSGAIKDFIRPWGDITAMEAKEGLAIANSAGAKIENLLTKIGDFITLKSFDDFIENRAWGLERAQKENAIYEPQIGKDFAKQEELINTRKRVADLSVQMAEELEALEAQERLENLEAFDVSAELKEEGDDVAAPRLRQEGEGNNPDIRFRQITIPEKPKFDDFNGDIPAFLNANKEYLAKTNEVLPEMAKELDDTFSGMRNEQLRKRQDADRFIKLQQHFVKEQGGVMTDKEDAYNDKNRSIGRSTHQSQEFERREMGETRDAYKAIIKSGVLDKIADVPLSPDTTQNMRKIGLYLQAKDIQEAIETGLVQRGEVGFFEAVGKEHLDYIDEFERLVAVEQVTDLWEAVNNATRYGLDQELRGGLMAQEDYDKHVAREYYVPQRGWDERDVANVDTHYNRDAGSMYGAPYNAVLIKAKGRQSLASDPLHFIQSMGHSALLTAEKNLYKQKALNMVRENVEIGRQSGAFNFKQVWYVNTGEKDDTGAIIYDEVFSRPDQKLFEEDKETRAFIAEERAGIREAQKAYRQAMAESDDEGMDAAKLFVDEATERIQELTDKINIQKQTNAPYKEMRTKGEAIQHEVVVFDKGEKYILWFKDERVSNALNNATDGQVTPYMQNLLGRSTRWYSSIMTQYNPAFALWNFMKDMGLANLALPMEQGLEFTLRFNKNVFDPRHLPGMLRHLTGQENMGKETDKMLENFFADGAATGYTYLKDLDQIKKDLRKAIEPTLVENTLGSQYNLLNAKALGKAFSAVTEYSELVTRFAGYKTAIEMGMTREQAATLAKELTVNFNRKGSDTKMLSSMFAFFNASVQGTYRASKLAKYGPAFAGVVASLAVLGFINTLMNPNDPEDEKNWSEFDRMQNVMIFGIKLPVTHYFRGFWAMGVQSALAYKGEKTAGNAVFDALKNFSGEIIPTGINPVNLIGWDKESNFVKYDGVRGFVPSVTQPVFDVLENKTYTGAMVHREAFNDEDERVPQSFLGKRDVSPAAQAFSDLMFEYGGGDKNIKDTYNTQGVKVPFVFDLNPSSAEYLATAYTGGVGKFVLDIYKSVNSVVETGTLDVSKLPVVNRAMKPYNEDKVFFGKYYELSNKIKTYENSTNVREKAFVQDGKAYKPAISDFVQMLSSPQGRLVYKAKGVQAQVESLQDIIETLNKTGNAEKAKTYQSKMNGYMKDIDELLTEWKSIKE